MRQRERLIRVSSIVAICGCLLVVVSPANVQSQPAIGQLPTLPGGGKIDIGPPSTPTILAPRPGAVVRSPIVVKGRATKESKVRVTATLTAAIPLISAQNRLGEAETTADNRGAWQVTIAYRILIKVPNARIVLEAVASNPLTGQTSNSTRIEVIPKQ